MNSDLSKDSSARMIALDPGGHACERCDYWVPDQYEGLPNNPTVVLGAGASIDAGLPGSIDLASQVSQDVINLPPNELDSGARELLGYLERDFNRHGVKPDIEMLLAATHLIGENAPALRGLRALLKGEYYDCPHSWALNLGSIIWDGVFNHLKAPLPQRLNYLEQLPPASE